MPPQAHVSGVLQVGGSVGDGGLVASPADNQVIVVSDEDVRGDVEDAPLPPAAVAAEFPVGTSGPAPAAMAAGVLVGANGLGTSFQTAADLLAASPFSLPTTFPREVSGMPVALRPLAITHPLPPPSANPPPPPAEVLLIVDTRDTCGSGAVRAEFLARLNDEPGLTDRVFVRQLPVGDALLVAKITPRGATSVDGAPAAGTEVVLDFLIERKTAEDLVASVKSGRLAEQAYFMMATGRPSLVCVVEGDVDAAVDGDAELGRRVSVYLENLTVSGGFVVRRTESMNETAAYYKSLVKHRGLRLGCDAGLSAWLNARNEVNAATTIPGVSAAHSYPSWVAHVGNMRSVTTLEQLWALQLHVLPRVGPARIDTILSAGFKTPAALAAAYAAVGSVDEGRRLLAGLQPPPRRAPISADVSAYVYDLFCSSSYGSRLG